MKPTLAATFAASFKENQLTVHSLSIAPASHYPGGVMHGGAPARAGSAAADPRCEWAAWQGRQPVQRNGSGESWHAKWWNDFHHLRKAIDLSWQIARGDTHPQRKAEALCRMVASMKRLSGHLDEWNRRYPGDRTPYLASLQGCTKDATASATEDASRSPREHEWWRTLQSMRQDMHTVWGNVMDAAGDCVADALAAMKECGKPMDAAPLGPEDLDRTLRALDMLVRQSDRLAGHMAAWRAMNPGDCAPFLPGVRA
ncbi:hypothetical protein [Bordetella genomosp. 9]|uniref:Uncharacterized protein n=1 Tax=Bordetella genomosp. 9 TaxID=1416803 RepID=A0A1W6Z1Z4_9BORD|nr:hypothetical protein [Bordetella genomosp. 9]ARP86833.1 hypothetical protein CAL13_11910 [Bordetella genomosp. 9]